MKNIYYISVNKRTGEVSTKGHDWSLLSYVITAQQYERVLIRDYVTRNYFLAWLLSVKREWVVIVDNKDRYAVEYTSAFELREFISQLSDPKKEEFYLKIKNNTLDESDASSWLPDNPEAKLPEI